MVNIEFGHMEINVPEEIIDDEIACEAVVYADIATFLMEIPVILKKYPRLKKSLKNDLILLNILVEIGHIVAG